MRAPIALTLVALLAAAAPGQAQTPTLTLQQAVQQALRAHPAVELAEANVARARSGVREAQAARLPALSVDGNITRFQEPMVVAPLHGFDVRNPPVFDRTLSQGYVNLGYTLFDAGRGGRIDRAEALAAAAQSGAAAVQMQLLADVSRAYLRVQAARELAEAHERRTVALAAERDRAAQLVEQGRAARVVLLRADAALSAARADAVTAANEAEIAEHDLARQLGVAPDSLHDAALARVRPASMAVPVIEELRAAAHESNPDLQRARRQWAAASAGRSEARGSWLPRFQLGGRYIEYASTESAPQGEWQGSVLLSYPVFTGGARAAANDRAAADVRAAQAEYGLAERRVADALERALSTLRSSSARVLALEAAVSQSQEVTRIDRLALQAGAGVQSEYLTAEADLFRARAALTEARALQVLADIELARISGQLTEDWIARNVESYQ